MAITDLSGFVPATEIDPAMATDQEVGALLAAYLLKNPTELEFGQAEFNNIDFNTGPIKTDFAGRIIVSGGGNLNGLAQILFQFALANFNSKVSVNGGAQLSRFLLATTTVDLPGINSGATAEITRSVTNALVGDIVFFVPTEMPVGLSFLNFQAIISSAGVARVVFRNLSSAALDIVAFSAKILVVGF